jgi:antitoxin component of MazEF toxin-antitoxin module
MVDPASVVPQLQLSHFLGIAGQAELSVYLVYTDRDVYTNTIGAIMIQQQLRKVGNSYVVTIPKDEVERLELEEGQILSLEITPMELRPKQLTELKHANEESWKRNEAGYRYLADR